MSFLKIDFILFDYIILVIFFTYKSSKYHKEICIDLLEDNNLLI